MKIGEYSNIVPRFSVRRVLVLLIALAGSIASLAVAVSQIDARQLALTFQQVQTGWLGLALLTMSASIAAKAGRWRLLGGNRSRLVSWCSYLASHMIGVLLPSRLGDLARLVLMRVNRAGNLPDLVSALIIEKEADTLGLVLLVGLVMVTTGLPVALSGSLPLLAAIALAVLVVLCLLLWRGAQLLQVFRQGIWRWVQQALLHVLMLHRKGYLYGAAGLTLLQLGCGVITNLLVFQALDLPVLPGAALATLVAIYVGLALVAPLAGIGVFELTVMLVLQNYGITADAAFAAGVLLHAVVLVTSIVFGLTGSILLNREAGATTA